MSGNGILRGLCLTCRNASDCAFPRETARPVWQCEEFAGDGKVPEKISMEGIIPSRTGWVEVEATPGAGMGLCKNCANRQDCRYPKPEGGVWRCEEYE